MIFEYAEDKVAIGSAPIDATQFGEPIIYSSPLKQQLADSVPLEKILCSNSLHVLTERTNGNLACVYPSTAEKLGWKLINQEIKL